MTYYVRPSSDIFVKYLFGRKRNRDLLIDFINAVLAEGEFEAVVDVELLNPFNIKEFQLDKESILDIKAEDERGRLYDIEVQTSGTKGFKNRSLFYWARLYAGQIEEGAPYADLSPTICINMLDFILFTELPNLHNCFLLRDTYNCEYILTDHLALHYIELPKLESGKSTPALEKWSYFFRYEGSPEVDMKILLKDDDNMKKAHRQYKKFTQDEKMRELYEAREKFRKDVNTRIHDNRKEGREEGLQEGLKKGLQEGRQEGREEEKKLLAAKLKQAGMEIAFIQDMTGLSEEEIQNL